MSEKHLLRPEVGKFQKRFGEIGLLLLKVLIIIWTNSRFQIIKLENMNG